MPSPREGILTSPDWEEIKPDFGSTDDWTLEKEWQPYWKPSSAGHKHRRALSRIRTLFWPKSRPQTQNLRPTAYLDGLRGFAALLVYWHHNELWAHDRTKQNGIFENGFGYEGNYHLVAFPGIRQFVTGGHFAVSVFLVISGYVLSLKPLNLIQAGDTLQLGDHVASALFRRWLRLFLPIIAVLLVYVTSWHLFGIWVEGIEQEANWWDEMCALYKEFKNFSFIYKVGGDPWLSYSRHLWSIPLEFKGSVVIYSTVMALSRCSVNARLWCQAGIIFYFMYITDGWYCSMFVAGMLLCDLDLLAERDELPRFLARLEPYKTFIYYHLFALALFLGGVPCENDDIEQLARNRGWYLLSYLKPQAVYDYKWFYLFWAALLMVASVPHIHWLKRFFETRFCQYLGRISYGLYMVHGPVLWTLGDRLYMAAGYHNGDQLEHIPHWADKLHLSRVGPVGFELSFVLLNLVLLPITLFLAELVTRTVDTPSVKFASWLYKRTLAADTPASSPIKPAKGIE